MNYDGSRTVKVDDDYVKAIKIIAIKNNKKLKEALDEALKDYINKCGESI